MENNGKLEGKRYAVVTGANKGIGLEIARQLASQGITVVLTARNENRGKEATSKLQELGLSNLIFHQFDVLDPISIELLAKFLGQKFGRLDILLSGKAAKMVQGVLKQTYEGAEQCLKTNYFGAKKVTEALLPLLQLSPSGARIVNISSLRGELKRIPSQCIRNKLGDIENLTEEKLDGLVQNFLNDFKDDEIEANGWPLMLPAYSISKAALNAYTRILARKYPKMCINCVHPGYVKTDLNFHTEQMSMEEGAKGPIKCALIPDGGPTGCYFDQTQVAEF
ncbi:hypothetical protein REPUB_Repub05bG0131800 [Reevesia pubescens]